MFTRMLKLRLLNAVAPAYFFMATAVTFILHFCFFVPTIFPNPDTSLKGSTTLHTVVFLFLMFNALGNYIMTIKYPAESANETAVPVCSLHCSDKVDAHYLLNGRHFCKLLEYSISFENPLTFLTLLPISTGYFFMGTISGLQLFLVLMLYVWLGIGLVCAGFCCQQVLLVARGQTWCQMQRGQLMENCSPWRTNLKDVFGTRWILGLILPVQTVETSCDYTDAHKQD
ncbi:palmitoyltransferase ZDHHC22 isoform X2 [Dicentrarchus labrax]|uniref:palmitoyltransferase ZDHHC22 isoform X2 n=1 Tax=Dicentrarchus labrax TaxID=13489 RepID=UPI0021F5A500|nr:palmitoyltransferase ZDHHC22 isoform X2 [Dicentrarchus labrax]